MKNFIFVLALLLTYSVIPLNADEYFFFSPAMISTHLKDYSPEEKIAIDKDLNVVRSVAFEDVSSQNTNINSQPFFLATAGAPGARKSTILERFLKTNPEYSHGVYVDPDQRALKFMVHTYQSRSLSAFAVAENENFGQVQRKAYEKWRGASNYITLVLLEEAFAKHQNVIHGSTSTGDHIPFFLKKVKEAGYKISLLLCYCEDSTRVDAVKYRNEMQRFYQSTPEDVLTKGKAFPQKMSAYFTNADELYLYWSDDITTPEKLAATLKNGFLVIYDTQAYDQFTKKYESDRQSLKNEGKEIPSWNSLLELYQATAFLETVSLGVLVAK